MAFADRSWPSMAFAALGLPPFALGLLPFALGLLPGAFGLACSEATTGLR